MKIGVKAGKKIATILVFVVMAVLAFIALFPFYYIFLGSIQDQTNLFTEGMKLYVTSDSLAAVDNYTTLFTYNEGVYFSWYKNSILITLIFTVVALVLSSWVGYGIAAYNFKLKNFTFVLVLIVMMIPLEIIMLPLYKLCVSFGILNSYAGIILPFMVAPVAIFFFRQFLSGISKDFMEAGRIDGCTEVGIFIRIITPLLKPAYGAMTILLAMQQWNSFVWPLIVLREGSKFTIPLGIASMINPYTANYVVMFCGSVLAIVPILILFLCNQRFFISGLTSGGVKG